jgi:hypothetical protein
VLHCPRRYPALFFADVGAERPDQGVGLQLFHDEGGPAGDAAGDEERGEDLGVEADEVVGGAAGVVEVGVPISSKNCITASLAPPCSGPLSALMAPTTAEYRSERVLLAAKSCTA